MAGLTLKAEVDKSFACLSNETLEYLKGNLMRSFFDP
jgi:hypothetical protein